jgi:hypothetical protein
VVLERVVPTGHPKMNQQRTSKIIQERVVPTGHPKMNQQRTSKIKQERVVPTGHPKTNLNYSLDTSNNMKTLHNINRNEL